MAVANEIRPDRWPFAPGEGPYKIKGTAYRGHIEYVQEHVPGGMEAMLEALPDDRYRTFFETLFLAGGWYDIYPLAYAGVVCARLSEMGFMDFVDLRSRHQAPRDLNGVYRFLLRMVPTNSVARRIPKLLAQVLNFTTNEVLQDQEGHMRGALHGMPAQLGAWFATAGSAYGEEALKVSGGLDASINVDAIQAAPSGDEQVAMVTLLFDIRWTE